MKSIGILIQARMNSSRLPGKMLKPLAGSPMLTHLVGSLKQCTETDFVAVATSSAKTDDPIANYCKKHRTPCFRGNLENVAKRMTDAAKHFSLEAFVRICGDSPLIDHRVVDQGISIFRQNNCLLVTNVHPRSFPKGQSVEVLDSTGYRRAMSEFCTPSQQEHMTSYLYENAKRFSIINFESGEEAGGSNLCVDTAEDFVAMERIYALMDRPHWKYRWQDILHLQDKARM